MEWLMKYLWVWLSLSLLFSPAARAQPANSSDSTDMIRALLARVEQLEKRVAELEGRPGVPAPAAQPVTAAAEPANRAPDTIPTGANQVAEAPPAHMGHGGIPQISVPSTHIAGFSD